MRREVQRTNFPATAVLLSILLVVWLGACSRENTGTSARAHRPVVLGFSPIVSWGSWNGANADSVRRAARDAGMQLRLDEARHSQEKQVAILRSFVSQRVDVIAFSPVVENGWESVLGEIRSAGIPVILMDRRIEIDDDSLYASWVGSDFVEEGRRAGRWLLEHTADVAGDIDIVELRGSVGSAPANQRKQGFAEIISADPRYHILHSKSAEFDRAMARRIMAEFLRSEARRIRVLFAHNDGMALGGIDALEDAGFAPGRDVLVISIEGSREGLEAIVAGKLNASVECSPLLGPQLVGIAVDLANGRPVPRRVITRESLFTRENAAAELPQRTW